MNKKIRKTFIKYSIARTISCIGLFLFSVISFLASAQQELQDVFIPTQPLSEALIDFSAKFNRVVIGLPQTLKGHISNEVKGKFSSTDALKQLIAGTGLEIHTNAGGGYLIVEPHPVQESEYVELETIAQRKLKLDSVEEIFVFGRSNDRRPKISQTSMMFLDSNFFLKNDIETVDSITKHIPNVFSANSENDVANINIRGIDNRGLAVQSTTPVAFHYNNIYILPTEVSSIALFDLESAKIFKGSQNTETGRASVAGSVYLDAASPALDKKSASISVTLGKFNRETVQATVNLPTSDTHSLRLASHYHYRDGYVETWEDYRIVERTAFGPELHYPNYDELEFSNNRTSPNTNIDDYENANERAWRLSSLWRPNDNYQWLVSYESHQHDRTGNAFIDPFIVKRLGRAAVVDTPGKVNTDLDILSSYFHASQDHINFDYRFGWTESDFSSIEDSDLGRLGIKQDFRINYRDSTKMTHNFELYNSREGSPFEWLVGLYYEDTSVQSDSESDALVQDDESQVVSQGGFFIQAPETEIHFSDIYSKLQYALTDNWSIFTGARYSISRSKVSGERTIQCDDVSIDQPGVDSLNGEVPENLFISENLRNGENFGGTNVGASPEQQCFLFSQLDDEKSWRKLAYQLGSKVEFYDDISSTLKFATGHRPGALQAAANINAQRSKNIELDTQGLFFNKRLFVNTVLFYAKHRDMHVPGNRYADLDGDGIPTDYLITDVQNNADVTNQGIELSLSYEMDRGGKFDLAASYIDTNIDNYEIPDGIYFNGDPWNPASNDSFLASLGFRDLSGNRLTHAPEYTVNFNYEHDFYSQIGKFTSLFQIFYTDDYYLDLYNRENNYAIDGFTNIVYEVEDFSRQDSQLKFDFSLKWQNISNTLDVKIFIENITGEATRNRVTETFFSSRGFASTYAKPRTYGVSLSLSL